MLKRSAALHRHTSQAPGDSGRTESGDRDDTATIAPTPTCVEEGGSYRVEAEPGPHISQKAKTDSHRVVPLANSDPTKTEACSASAAAAQQAPSASAPLLPPKRDSTPPLLSSYPKISQGPEAAGRLGRWGVTRSRSQYFFSPFFFFSFFTFFSFQNSQP